MGFDFDFSKNLKVQRYANEQNIDTSEIETLDFNTMYTVEEYQNIKNTVEKYRAVENEHKQNPSVETTRILKELSEDIMYQTGQDASKIQLSSLNTQDKLEKAMMETNLRSRNDLRVDINYDDYSSNSNYCKVRVVGHNYFGAYGISANARMIVLNNGDIIVPKNSLYSK